MAEADEVWFKNHLDDKKVMGTQVVEMKLVLWIYWRENRNIVAICQFCDVR